MVRALIEAEPERQVLAPPHQVVFGYRRLEQRERVLLELEGRIEPQAPKVAGHEQQIDVAGKRRRDGHDRDHARQVGCKELPPGDRERRRRLDVSGALVDQQLVVGLSGPEEHLSLEDRRARAAVKRVEPLEAPVAPREHRLGDDMDAADHLAVWRRIDHEAERGERVVDRGLLERPESTRAAVSGRTFPHAGRLAPATNSATRSVPARNALSSPPGRPAASCPLMGGCSIDRVVGWGRTRTCWSHPRSASWSPSIDAGDSGQVTLFAERGPFATTATVPPTMAPALARYVVPISSGVVEPIVPIAS